MIINFWEIKTTVDKKPEKSGGDDNHKKKCNKKD